MNFRSLVQYSANWASELKKCKVNMSTGGGGGGGGATVINIQLT